ncbi:MAG: hypothetical protein OXG52_09955 [bacterium]|nr:hypothetical protein [bacterium]
MFDRASRALDLCTDHLADTATAGTEIESFIVGYALTVVHAEFEKAVKNAIRERCRVVTDPHLRNFTSQAADRLVRSIKITELSGILGYFDGACKSTFQDSLRQSKSASFYNNIETNRQAVAHDAVHNATMSEVTNWFAEAQTVIVRFREALGLDTPAEQPAPAA